MKLKTIATIFKRNKFFRIWNEPNGAQWITNGVAAYSMEGMPELTPAMLLKIFDISEEKQTEWNCEVEPMPAELFEICSDYRRPRTPLEAKNVTVQYNGIVHMLLNGSGGEIVSIDEKYIKPLYDDMDYLRLYKCKLQNGFAVICHSGFETTAVIMALRVGETLAKELLEIGKYFNSISYTATSDTIIEHIPPAASIDPETGEVLDGDMDELQETLEEGAGDEKATNR